MKKITLYLLILISIFCININVFAESTNATKTDDGIYDDETKYNELKKYFDNGIKTQNITKNGYVKIYGKSDCDSTGCDHEYIGGTTDLKTVLTKTVVCTNGEKYIIYQQASSGQMVSYKETTGDALVGTAYWDEVYDITCTNESGINTIPSNTSNNTSNTGTNTGNNNSSNEGTNAGNNNGSSSEGYNSSTTTPNPNQGVETYYIILAVVAVISYFVVFMIKKYNLFKKV